ncbi:peptidoglycan editing factor PgeF [Crassaminicella thermophila]|uniref:Purine nucleoside phosphorylase n=1 Tax=Crassaminicella thermophila TaxID=2599308 RepID=A0A5C0SF81_CRATE|nr:peptidoglycan editing factor PgeF [Crassaminicella thermophila]QEK11964.1 peptidoglycan editing factor PgeF [Crassaminicella thermophila]
MNGFKKNITKSGVVYFSIPNFDNTGLVKSCFTSRVGGVSKDEYNSLNLGLKTCDKKENVINNYRLICEALDIPMSKLVCSDQVHGDNIKIVTEKDCGKGILKYSDIIGVDALITNIKNVALVTVYADCVPIFLLDPMKKVIALIHAGWRGTVSKIAKKVVKKMMEEFNSKPEECLAAIGPSIGKCCYEVDKGVIDKFNENFTNLDKFVISKGNNKYMLDLWEANKIVLKEIGILERNIIISGMCTMCNKEIFFSYRKANGITGRMAAIMELR